MDLKQVIFEQMLLGKYGIFVVNYKMQLFANFCEYSPIIVKALTLRFCKINFIALFYLPTFL